MSVNKENSPSNPDGKYDCLQLDRQLCFPLYACAKEVVRRYKPYLDRIDLTYTQYIVMMVIWEKEHVTTKEIGDRLHLDSGTLTPVVNKLVDKGFVKKERSKQDARDLDVTITEDGRALKEKAVSIPASLRTCVKLTDKEAVTMYRLLNKMLDGMEEQ